MMRCLIILTAFAAGVSAFAPLTSNTRTTDLTRLYGESTSVTVDLPPAGSGRTATMNIESALTVPSEFIAVRYKVPFELSVEPKQNLAICTKDGSGGEKVGDVLRFSSQWKMGLPDGEGIAATAAAFSGGT